MIPQKSSIILFITAVFIAAPLGLFVWNESFYFDPVPFLSPVEYHGNLPIRSDLRGGGDFGARRNGNRRHQGIDILASIGTPVKAAKGGLAFAAEHRKGLGKFVEIKHKGGLVTVYSHLSRINIKPIQRVRQGEVIGAVGKTGNARYRGIKSHLHFEVRRRGVAIDPKRYLCK